MGTRRRHTGVFRIVQMGMHFCLISPIENRRFQLVQFAARKIYIDFRGDEMLN